MEQSLRSVPALASLEYSWCRHCGLPRPMTREHVPPRTVGNDQPVGRIDEPFDQKAVVREVAEWKEGHVVRTLCDPCNHRASAWGYVAEYRRWHDLLRGRARQLAAERGTDPLRGSGPFPIELPYAVQPGRFVRQVIGMFQAVQATEHLLVSYPLLADFIGADPDDGDRRRQDGLSIHPLHLRLSVCNTDWCYLTRPGMSVEVPLGGSGRLWTPPGSRAKTDDALLLVLAPFAFALTTNDSADMGVDVSEWTTWGVDDRPRRTQRGLSIPTADQLVGWARAMIYPADYVSRPVQP